MFVLVFVLGLVAVAVGYPPATFTSDEDSITVGNLDCDTNYRIRLEEYRSGAWRDHRVYERRTAGCPDTTRPSAPVLSGTPGDGRASLSWTAATDASGIDRYEVWRNNSYVAELPPSQLSYTDTGLTNETSYTYRVVAYDGSPAGNFANSNNVTVTPTDPPPPPPPPPSGWNLVYSQSFDTPCSQAGCDLYDGGRWRPYGHGGDWPGHNGNGLRTMRSVSVHDGYLDIVARMVNGTLESGAFYLVAPLLQPTYGRYEAIIQTDGDPSATTSGVALLWNNDEANHPWCNGEADFYETALQRATFYSFLHYELGTPNCADAATQDQINHNADPKQWHHVALEWEANRWAVYSDGQLKGQITDPAHIPDWAQRLVFQYDAFDPNLEAGTTHMKVAWMALYRR